MSRRVMENDNLILERSVLREYTCWGELLNEAAEEVGDKILCSGLEEKELSEEFEADDMYLGDAWFYAWGVRYVFFPIEIDGRVHIEKALRCPEDAIVYLFGGNCCEKQRGEEE